MLLLLAANLTAVQVVDQKPGARDSWVCAYAEQRLSRVLQASGLETLWPAELADARKRLAVDARVVSRATAYRVAAFRGATSVIEIACAVEAGPSDPPSQKTPDTTLRAREVALGEGRARDLPGVRGSIESLPALVDQLAAQVLGRDPVPLESPGPRGVARIAEGLSASSPATAVEAFERAAHESSGGLEPAILGAYVALSAGDTEGAVRLTARSPAAHDPLSRELLFLRGVSELRASRARAAEATFRDLLPGGASAGLLSNLGLARLRAPMEGAVDHLREAAALAPRSPEIAVNTAVAFLARGDATAALFWAEGALRLDPLSANAQFLRSVALARIGKSDEARTARAMARAIDPDVALGPGLGPSDDARALSRLDASDAFLTISLFERVAPGPREGRSAAERAASSLRRAETLLARRAPEQALAPLRDVVYENPFEGRAHHLIGRAHRALGQLGDARRALTTALWCREDQAARLDLVETLMALRETKAAQSEAAPLLATVPWRERALKALDQHAEPVGRVVR
jgi:tetratricopeptide (TPR) repeat protein